MKICEVLNWRVHKIYTQEEASWYKGIIPFHELPDEVEEGWAWDGSSWVDMRKITALKDIERKILDTLDQQRIDEVCGTAPLIKMASFGSSELDMLIQQRNALKQMIEG